MASIVLTVPDEQMGRVVDALCAVNGWVEGGVTRADFARACIIRDLAATVQGWERRQAEQAAIESVTVGPITIS